MAETAHTEELLFVIKSREWGIGHVAAVASPPDNTRAVLLGQREDDHKHVIVDGGAIAAEYEPLERPLFTLSPDGKKLAVFRPVREGRRLYHRAFINGAHAYDIPLNLIHHIDWISNDDLAVQGWNKDYDSGHIDEHGIRYYLNGEDKTDACGFRFAPFLDERHRSYVQVRIGCLAYVVRPDGSRSESYEVEPLSDARRHDVFAPKGQSHSDRWKELRGHREQDAEIIREDDGRRQRLRYRGKPGPAYDGIEKVIYSADGNHVAYVGEFTAAPAAAVARPVHAVLEASERVPLLKKAVNGLLAVTVLPLVSFMGWVERSKRVQVLQDGVAWPQHWRYADDLHFLPDNRLVACCYGRSGQHVVIDGKAGPAYDSVHNVGPVPGENALSYVAHKGDKLLRVTVAL